MSAFEEVGVAPELIRAVEELGWTLPTPIQAECVPLILGGGDIMAAAETGSGKTGAFALPVLQIVHEAIRTRQRSRQNAPAGGGGGGADAPPACMLNAEDRDSVVAVSPDGLRCQARSEQAWGGVRGTVGAFGGRVYYEATVSDEGLCRVGWSTQAASLDLGTDRHSFGFGGTGKKSHNRSFDSYGEPYGLNDTIGCLLDCEAGSIAFSKNGQLLGPAFQLPQYLQGQALYPAICLKNAELAVNLGATPFKHGPPPGFVGLASAPRSATASWQDTPSSSGADRKPLAIILEPARDLAEQTHNNFTAFCKYLADPALRNELLVGGTNPQAQVRALQEGLDIVVGTPGRVMDFIETGKLPCDQVKFFVLDEADRLLDTGNQDVIMKMFRRFPKAGAGVLRLQVLLFSATLHSPEVRALAGQICQNPIIIDLKGKDAVPETVDHVLVRCDPQEDRSWLQSNPAVFTDNIHALDRTGQPNLDTRENWSEAVKRLKQRYLQRIIDAFQMDQCLIFCRTNFDCDNLEKFLNSLGGGTGGGGFRGKRESGRENPYSCLVLAGARSMDERRAALEAFKEGDVRFLICTDVAARGIDIQGLPYVINMTLPDRSEDYIHRVGRVGRADTMGLAISLVSSVPEKVWYCTVKGIKPWLAPDAKNTRTNEQGGHTIWYDEPQLLQDVEKRLTRRIPALAADLSLPAEIAARVAGTQAGSGGATQYGQQRGGGVSKDVMERVQAVRPAVQELARLEHQAQTSFFLLKRKWAAVA